ncbi:MAG: cytochrome C oxidase subunit IV family protein [Polyangiales bacterium]
MSDHAPAHGHGHHAPDHVPHVTPLYVYLATWGTLVVLTAITVGASYLNFGGWNLIIALLIATIKAAVVAALFMHLLHDSKFHALILVSGALFLIIFVSFTMFDTEFRGRATADKGERPADITRPFEGTKSQMLMKAKYEHGDHAAAAAASASGAAHAAAPAASGSEAAAHETAHGEPAASASATASGSAAASASAAPAMSASAAPAMSASAAPAKSAHP